MSDDPDIPGDEEIDPGSPVEVLAEFEYAPSTTFLGRVRRSINRRSAISQVASFSWNAPRLVVREFLSFMVEHFLPRSAGKDHPR